jgi:transmembrane sensor
MLREALTLARLHDMTPDEASAYFVSHEPDELTPEEQSLLAEWLAADEAHALAYERAKRAWGSLEGADGHEILDAMRAHARSQRKRRIYWPLIFSIAAMLVLVVGTSLLFFSPYGRAPIEHPRPVAGAVPWTQYASAENVTRAVSLSDGSVLTLDADSLALVRLLPGERSIRLARGRAFFDVAKDVARPFVVAAGNRRVVALGTRFEVDASNPTLRVSLFRGKVGIAPLAGVERSVFLDPGQQFIEKDGQITVTRIADGGKDPAWLSGLLVFDATPLGEAVRQVNRYSQTKIRITDPAVAAIHVTGQFRVGDADRFAETIAEAYPVKVVRRHNRIDLIAAK